MKFTLHSPKPAEYSSVAWFESAAVPGCRYAVRKTSLGQRLELNRRARELAMRYEFLQAGNGADQLEASASDLLVQKLYLEWGIVAIEGMRIDGVAATCELVIESGPEALAGEMLQKVRAELELSEEERKNS